MRAGRLRYSENVMSEVRRIASELHRAYEGPAWHGPALKEILAGVGWEMAAARPIAEAHSIWELVLHLTVWMNVVRRRLAGAEIPTLTSEQDWPASPEASEAAWNAAIEGLAAAQRDLEAAVREMTDERLREIVQGDVPYPIHVMLHGTVQHNLYHGGQMALLKKAARA